MKQSKSIINPATGTTTEMMMIWVEWSRRTGTEPAVGLAEESAVAAGVAEGSAVANASSPKNVGEDCDGGNVAVHPSYPTSSLKEEYASSRKLLYERMVHSSI